MLKITLTVILLVALLFSTACRNLCSESKVKDCIFIEDLDYMRRVLEENFPFWGVAYRERGVDIAEIFDDMRSVIHNTNDMTEIEFNALLIRSFRPLRGVAHFSVNRRFREATPDGVPPFAAMLIELYTEDPIDMRQYLISALGQELAELFIEALRDEDVGEIMRLNELALYIIESRENVNIEIIEGGRIAYLSVDSFLVSNAQIFVEERKIFGFFEEIQDFEHLIIDLRKNGGGRYDYGLRLISALIQDTHIVDAFVFVNDGDSALAIMAPPDTRWPFYRKGFTEIENELRPISEMMKEYELPELNNSDAERMSYGFRAHARISPSSMRHSGFKGEIWLLTSRNISSAAQITTWLFKETGLATLVGDVTGGNYGGERITRVLPNTGIPFLFDSLYITDHNGRPLEAGTIPHHFNHPGMDAMETVLALIAEGKY